MHTLVLGPDFQPLSALPLSVIHWQDAVKLFFLNKIQVLEWYDDWHVRSAKLTMRVPAVVATHSGFKKNKLTVAFTRNNVFLRDMFQCGYCSGQFKIKDLTIDHVIPRSSGGTHTWTNVITACKSCNESKGTKLWKPLWVPKKPSYYSLAKTAMFSLEDIRHESWHKYLPTRQRAS